MPDLPAAHPTNTRDGAALLNERFAARTETQAHSSTPRAPIAGESVAVRLIASWFAPAPPADDDA